MNLLKAWNAKLEAACFLLSIILYKQCVAKKLFVSVKDSKLIKYVRLNSNKMLLEHMNFLNNIGSIGSITQNGRNPNEQYQLYVAYLGPLATVTSHLER